MKKKDTDIHKPDGLIFNGENIGHADKQSRIRKRDGFIFRGEEMGYVDDKGKIRRPDGFIFKGDEVGQVKGVKVHGTDWLIFSGDEWGYIDQEGNIRQKDGFIFKGRIIGKMRGNNQTASLGYFVLRFKEMEDQFNELESVVRNAENKTHYLAKVRHMLSYVPNANALGDFDGLIRRLKNLESDISNQFDKNRHKKEDIVKQAESLSLSTNWKIASEEIKKLQEKWKQIRSAGEDYEEVLWQRFRTALDEFYRHRSEYFEKEKRKQDENQSRKERLCSMAESLTNSNDTKEAIVKIKQLQIEWKSIGHVSREQSEILWDRFRHACDSVFENARKERERKSSEWEKRNREMMDNQRKKERLCNTAESLVCSNDTKAAVEQIKELQSDWKSIGQVPKDQADSLWEKFRYACDRVFQNAKEERERKQAEWRVAMQDVLDRKREQANRLGDSIAHDEENIGRWKDIIDNLHDGGRADEIRDSLENRISDVEDKIQSKNDRLSDLETTIREIEKKLYD